jgi:hypothetical protein
MTASEAKAAADAAQPALEAADLQKVMDAISVEANKGKYELSYLEIPMKKTAKKLQDPPNNFTVKDLWDNENRFLIKW